MKISILKKVLMVSLVTSACFFLPIGVEASNEYDDKVDLIVDISGAPRYVIEDNIKEIAEQEKLSIDIVTELLLEDMKNEEDMVPQNQNVTRRASSTLPSSYTGDIWFSKATTSFYNHGHVALYQTTTSLIEARGSGYTVATRNISQVQAKSGDLVLAVKMTTSGNSRINHKRRQAAVDWAVGKTGHSYAYTVNNKTCGNNDYNCSQLVWCAYNNTASIDLDSDGTWFVSPTDIKNSNWVYTVWSY